MKILCINYEYPPIGGGGASVAHPLAAALVAKGHSVDVVTSGMPDLPETETVDGVRIHRVRCARTHRHYTTTAELMTWIWPAYRKARELSAVQHYDLNHTHFALPSGLVSWMLHRKTGLPYLTTIHGSDVPGYNPDRFGLAHLCVKPLWRRIVRSSSRVVSPSHFLKDLLRRHLDVPVEVVPNGYAPKFGDSVSAAKRNRILVVTRMFPRKGVQHFLDALVGLRHDWDVVIAGDGPYLPALEAQAKRLQLNVNFVGFVQGDTLAGLYATSRIFVFPSMQENFPTVLLEAMEAGCAIVTADSGGCAEVIGDAGIATRAGQAGPLRHALEDLLADPATVSALGAAARARIARFRWPGIASRYEELMRETMATPPGIALDVPAAAHAGDRE